MVSRRVEHADPDQDGHVDDRVPAPRPPIEATVVLSAGDQLSEAQTLRLAAAVALLRAKKIALATGMTCQELGLHAWTLDIQQVADAPIPPQVAPDVGAA
jgi:hypothetical protein